MTVKPPQSISPRFIQGGRSRLFGALWSAAAVRGGVLFCNQVGPDYAACYKTGRLLAAILVAGGWTCLRFDYAGWGDSEGEETEYSVRDWIDNISSAHQQLKQTGIRETYLCGFGFGGALAAKYASQSGGVSGLILWNPVTDGGAYAASLRDRHGQLLHGSFARASRQDRVVQSMGFVAAADLASQMSQIRLTELQTPPAGRVLIVAPPSSRQTASLAHRLRELGVEVAVRPHGSGAMAVLAMRATADWLNQ